MIEYMLEAERAMSFGRIERAEEIYRQVAESDPRNSIAVVGLARVALERADDLGAYLLARRALTIDPENEAARRLAVRIEEVLATRGQPVDDPLPQAAVQAPAQPPEVEPEAAHETPPPTASAPRVRSKRRSLIDRLRRR